MVVMTTIWKTNMTSFKLNSYNPQRLTRTAQTHKTGHYLADPKIPHDVFGLAATLVLLYGLDDLALIESTCLHYPKNQKLSFSLFSICGGKTSRIKSFKLSHLFLEKLIL
jgi:hypothetical protein